MNNEVFTVIDFFCGAGGFSEGFRQQGFEIVLAVDKWKPAIDTFNHNFNKNYTTKSILDYESIQQIETLPDTDVIIGSPPCVSFSNSNRSGKADKSLGIKLTECYLRIVALKMHKPNSKLKAWFMENVVNSKKHLQESYSFRDLNLQSWASDNSLNPDGVAICLKGNSVVMNSADYGSLQARKRLISGEIIKYKKFVTPLVSHRDPKKRVNEQLFDQISKKPVYRTLGFLQDNFPSPFEKESIEIVKDPSYKIFIRKNEITDHFYDTGKYSCEWKNSYYLKSNHPYMGRMAFPEDPDKPSRTVTATNIGSSREALIYRSELYRKGDGEFRTPTVRESAIIMGFPITYQFLGSEGAKIRLVGNAVCPSISNALAKEVREAYGIGPLLSPILVLEPKLEGVNNLNTYANKAFDNPPKRKKDSRFRRHPFKNGNMTIALSNYDIMNKSSEVGDWRVTAFYGTGEGFGTSSYCEQYYKELEPIILDEFEDGEDFINIINNGFSDKIASKELLQEMHESQTSIASYMEPAQLVDEVTRIVESFDLHNEVFAQKSTKVFNKSSVPKRQLYALYALNKIISIANPSKNESSVSHLIDFK